MTWLLCAPTKGAGHQRQTHSPCTHCRLMINSEESSLTLQQATPFTEIHWECKPPCHPNVWQTLCLPIRVRQVTACSTGFCWVWRQLMPAAEVIPLGFLELQAFQKYVISFWLYPKHHKLSHVLVSARWEQALLFWGAQDFFTGQFGSSAWLMRDHGHFPTVLNYKTSTSWKKKQLDSLFVSQIFLICSDSNWCISVSQWNWSCSNV